MCVYVIRYGKKGVCVCMRVRETTQTRRERERERDVNKINHGYL